MELAHAAGIEKAGITASLGPEDFGCTASRMKAVVHAAWGPEGCRHVLRIKFSWICKRALEY